MLIDGCKIESYINELVNNGYFLIRNVIPKNLLNEIKNVICEKLVKLGATKDSTFSDQYYSVAKKHNYFEINRQLMREIVGSGLSIKILKIPEILNCLINIIGPDLVYETSSELPVNIKNETNDSLIKKYHQEFWSGSGYRTFTFWAPIFLTDGAGTLEVIKKSHSWGHIPHQNREPKFIPDDVEKEIINCNEGDALIFHSLTLHRTVPNQISDPRLAYVTQIRNFCESDTGFDRLNSWEVFNLSAASRIMKLCGNPHLSPFRIHGSTRIPIAEKY